MADPLFINERKETFGKMMKLMQHPTTNIEPPTSNGVGASCRFFGCSMLVVECWIFSKSTNG
jgi:hypothetical protein